MQNPRTTSAEIFISQSVFQFGRTGIEIKSTFKIEMLIIYFQRYVSMMKVGRLRENSIISDRQHGIIQLQSNSVVLRQSFFHGIVPFFY